MGRVDAVSKREVAKIQEVVPFQGARDEVALREAEDGEKIGFSHARKCIPTIGW